MNKYRLDGLRFDSVINSPTAQGCNLPDGWSLLQLINNEMRARQPWKITIAEDLQDNEWITKETGAGGAGFGSQWDARFVPPIRRAVIAQNDSDFHCRENGGGGDDVVVVANFGNRAYPSYSSGNKALVPYQSRAPRA